MAVGEATTYTEIQLMAAAFGIGSPAIPSVYYLHISTSPVADDGSGVTEFSGMGYAPALMPAWGPVGTPGPTSTTTTADLTFPQPAGTWWTLGTPFYPYITDAAVGGNVLWSWAENSATPHIDHPLFYAAGSIILAFNIPTNATPTTFGSRALDVLTGAASYTPPSLYVGFQFNAGTGEPWDRFPTGGIPAFNYGDPNYVRKALALTTPAVVSGKVQTQNSGALTWTVGSSNPNPGANYTPTIWHGMGIMIWDATGDGGWLDPAASAPNESLDGNLIFSYFGSNPVIGATVAGGDTVNIPTGGIVFTVD